MDRGRLLKNQPYDESLEVEDGEEVDSVRSPTPRDRRPQSRRSATTTLPRPMEDNNDEDRKRTRRDEESMRGRPTEEDEEEDDSNEDDTDDNEEEEEDDDDDDDEEEVPGAYDPADYANLPVSSNIRDLFQYITRYSPQTIELDHCLKPFIPDYIPAVGDIDAFLKVPRPDGKPDSLGLLVLDEPSVKQSDPTVLTLWLSEETKQHSGAEQAKVSSVPSPQSNPRAVDSWVDSISALHRSKPAASVHYSRPMPDIDSLMQEWPPEVEELLGRVRLPPARLDCSLGQYVDLVCGMLDVPVHGSRVQALHLIFSLYLEFRDSQHFRHGDAQQF